jgi:hypothetical protein
LFVNGIKDNGNKTLSSATSWSFSGPRPNTLAIGGFLQGQPSMWNGWIDEFRVTKGAALYTSNFTPPTAPFPDPVCE